MNSATTPHQRPLTRGSHLSGVSITRLPDGQYETLTADAFVMAMGSYSPLLARTIGINLPIYPAKGYSATVPIEEPEVEVQTANLSKATTRRWSSPTKKPAGVLPWRPPAHCRHR